MVESRDEVSNDGSIRQFQGEKTALGVLYGVCTCGVASPKMMLQTVPNGGKTPNPAVVQPSQRPLCANSADGKCYAHSNTPRGDDSSCWVEGTKIGSRWSPATFIQLRVQGASSHRTLAGEKKRVQMVVAVGSDMSAPLQPGST